MPLYCYVRASRSTADEDPDLISFKHTFVEARDVDDAYRLGFNMFGPLDGDETKANDYACAIPVPTSTSTST